MAVKGAEKTFDLFAATTALSRHTKSLTQGLNIAVAGINGLPNIAISYTGAAARIMRPSLLIVTIMYCRGQRKAYLQIIIVILYKVWIYD